MARNHSSSSGRVVGTQPVRSSHGRTGADTQLARYMSAGYFVLALALVAAVFPSALRPPQPPSSTSAQLSPDAPPDDQQVVIAELGRGSSTTAGAGPQTGVGAAAGRAAAPPVVLKPSRGRCFGSPARQLESVYSVPCMPAWTDGNGGSTWRGVTATDIRVGIMQPSFDPGSSGEITDDPAQDENAARRTFRVLKRYFNENQELYGRKLRFFNVESARDQNDPTQTRATARRAAEEFQVFAALQATSIAELDELAQRGIVTFTLAHMNRRFMAERQPFVWSATPDSTGFVEIGSEYLCKKLHGKPPKWTDDPTFDYTKPRIFGMLAYQEGAAYVDNVPQFRKLAKERCGAEIVEAVEYGYDSTERTSGIATGIARLKAAGVTTVVSYQDFFTNPAILHAADEASYFPEWYLSGFGGMDVVDLFFQAYSPAQWRHAFGISVYEIPAREDDHECVRAYRSIEPDSELNYGVCYYVWAQMVQLFGAMQLAGPNLTPQSLQAALFAYGRHPPVPVWRMAGGYGPGDYTYPDYAAEIWYDSTVQHPNGRLGGYHYINGGRRFTRGEVTTDEPAFFKDPGLTQMPRGGG